MWCWPDLQYYSFDNSFMKGLFLRPPFPTRAHYRNGCAYEFGMLMGRKNTMFIHSQMVLFVIFSIESALFKLKLPICFLPQAPQDILKNQRWTYAGDSGGPTAGCFMVCQDRGGVWIALSS